MPTASSIPSRIANADRPRAREQHRHRDAAAEACDAGDELQDARARVLDRDLAQRLGRADAAGAARGGERPRAARSRCPPPSAATSGIQELPGAKPAGTTPWSASTSTIALRERPAGERRRARRPRARRSAPRRRSAGGPGAASRRARAARRSRAGAGRSRARTSRRRRTARPRRRCRPSSPKIAIERGAVGRARVAGVGVGGVRAVEDLDARAAAALAPALGERPRRPASARRRRRRRPARRTAPRSTAGREATREPGDRVDLARVRRRGGGRCVSAKYSADGPRTRPVTR